MTKSRTRQRLTNFRPALFIAIYLTFGILIGYNIGENKLALFMLSGACFLIAAFDLIINKNIPYLILYILSFATGVMLITINTSLDAIPINEYEISGRVVDIDYGEYSTYYVLDDWNIEGENIDISSSKKISLSSKDSEAVFGDIIKTKAKISYPKKATNINGFNQKLYFLNRGISYKAKALDEIEIIDNKIKLDSYFYYARSYFENTIDELYSKETAGIAKGLILGEKGDISEETYDMFKKGGTASILAVSGLHFGIISLFIFWFLSLLNIGRKTKFIITGLLIFIYAGIVGFSVSAIRALITALVIIVANLLGKKHDYLSFIAIAYILSLIINPSSLFTVGFLLSFGAVLTILALHEPLKKVLKWMPSKIGTLTGASISASIGTAPILINFFYYLSIVGVIANVIIIPVGSAAVIMVLLSVLFGKVLGTVFAFIGETLINLMNDIMNLFFKIPIVSIELKALPIIFIIAWFSLIFVMSKYFLAGKIFKRIISIILILIMVFTILFLPLSDKDELSVYFFDVGQGDATFIKTPSGKCYMIDTGRENKYREIERFLASQGYKLDGLILTHSDVDHMGGYIDLVENGYVENIYVSSADADNYGFSDNINIIKLFKGMEIELDEKTKIEVLYPDFHSNKEETNEMSLCLMLHYKDYRLLFTGDIDYEIEKYLIKSLEDIDVLKVSHHGSKNGSSPKFLDALDAEYAVIMCGENYYGHPSANTIYNLEKYCDIIYRTDYDGGISFSFGDEIKAMTVLGGEGY